MSTLAGKVHILYDAKNAKTIKLTPWETTLLENMFQRIKRGDYISEYPAADIEELYYTYFPKNKLNEQAGTKERLAPRKTSNRRVLLWSGLLLCNLLLGCASLGSILFAEYGPSTPASKNVPVCECPTPSDYVFAKGELQECNTQYYHLFDWCIGIERSYTSEDM